MNSDHIESKTNSRRRWSAFAGLCIGQALVSFNSSAITTVLSSIAREFDTSLSQLQWVVNGYVLIAASFVMLGGKWGEKYGRRRVFLVGLYVFLVGSILSGWSIDTVMLYAGRFSQAIGAALLLPSILSLIEDFFDGAEKKLAFGIWGATSGVSAALAIFASGAIAQFLEWRFIFWINVPFLLIAIFLMAYCFPVQTTKATERDITIDYTGLIALALFALGLIVALDEIQISGSLNSLSGWFGVAGGLGLIGFVFVERHVKAPIMALKLFANRSFVGGLLSILGFNIALYLILFEANLFFQNRLGFALTPFQSGLALLPMSICLLASTLVISELAKWISFEAMALAGMFLSALAMTLLYLFASISGLNFMIGVLCIAGIGIGVGSAPAAAVVMEALSAAFRSEAASFQMVVRYFGGALGVAVGASVYSLASASTLFGVLKDSQVPTNEILAIDSVIVGASDNSVTLASLLDAEHGSTLKAAAQDALVGGFAQTMLGGALVAIALLLVCAFLLKKAERGSNHSQKSLNSR